jgi:hypothetical protein
MGGTITDDNNNSTNASRHLIECYQMIEWCKEIPHFSTLPLDDQIALLKTGWNELLIAAFSHRSMQVKDGLQLASGLVLHRADAQSASVGGIFDRVLSELVAKMRELRVDRCELGCLRAIVLFNPEAKGIRNVNRVESLRESVYSTLERYCRSKYPQQLGRFAKLLLRLPALRSVALKCLDFLFICKLLPASEMDTYLASVLRKPSLSTRLSPLTSELIASGSESNSLMGLALSNGSGTNNGVMIGNASSLTGSAFGELNGNGSLSCALSVPQHSPQTAGLSPSQPLQAQQHSSQHPPPTSQHHQHSSQMQGSSQLQSSLQLKSPVDGNNNAIGNGFGQLAFGQSSGPLDGLNLLAGSAANSSLLASSNNGMSSHGSSFGSSMQSNRFQNDSNNSFSNNSAFSPMSLNGTSGSSTNGSAFMISETQSPLSL